MSLKYFTIIAAAFLILFAVYFSQVLSDGQRTLTKFENIHGIPYPTLNQTQIITEPLAHSDIQLQEPVLAKKILLSITFNPGNSDTIDAGIRSDSFWFSYNFTNIYSKEIDGPIENDELITKTITFPLTNKFQDTDQTVDLMFQARSDSDNEISWKVKDIKTRVNLTKPALSAVKDYIKSLLKRERAT